MIRKALLIACTAVALLCVVGAARGAMPDSVATPWFPPITHLPLDPPLRLTGTFGEYRIGHFHAGIDLSTGEVVGKPVYASLDGYIMRVRSSGAGYGRSIYLQGDDGRLLVYGHLDAFDEPLASYVAAAQDSAGVYEQDLWPDSTRFRVRAGQRLGWSGRSGTGPPHLHFEIRHGDMAYNPLRAGVTVEDTVAPVIRSVTLAALTDEDAGRLEHVSIGAAELGAPVAFGRPFRVIVQSVDARANGRQTMAPWSTSVESDSEWVMCQFDSVSWAEGMSEVDEVYDRGLAAPESLGTRDLALSAPARWRPRVLRTASPMACPGGWFGSGVGANRLRITSRDVAGNHTERTIVVDTSPRPADHGRREPMNHAPDLRVSPDSASQSGEEWRLLVVTVPARAVFEPGSISQAPVVRPASPPELEPGFSSIALGPQKLPLRSAIRVSWFVGGVRPDAGVGLYRTDGDGWELVGSTYDSVTHAIGGTTRQLGTIALFRDARAPRITLVPAARKPPPSPYANWTLEATLDEQGSGVDRRASWLVVDGKRVPSEWDDEVKTLRWKPLHPPSRGKHRIEVIATDRAGNVGRRRGTFVLD